MATLSISDRNYRYPEFQTCLSRQQRVTISSSSRKKIRASNRLLNKILKSGKPIYGVNTGFGKLAKYSIGPDKQRQLQLNLVRSHSAGVGKPFDHGLTRLMMILKLMTFSKGFSGVRIDVPEHIQFFLNHDILPLIPSQGSVGASGDLAPLSHLGLALVGEGDVHFQDRIMPSMLAHREVGLSPLTLEAKEGIALVNGTQVSSALGLKALIAGERLLKTADIAGALSVEGSLSSRAVFHAGVHKLKKHPGQHEAAENVWNLLKNSSIVKSHEDCDQVQDPYSFRCIPHVHGSSRDIFNGMVSIIENEANSVSDNPLVFPDGEIRNSGHFHAEPAAQALDSLTIAMAEIGSISERRTHFFMKGIGEKVPPFVAGEPGVESGLMMAQVTAASLVSENKTLAHPASVDSITTSGGHEDLVSMAPWAGRKCLKVIHNVAQILAIEFLTAGTALVNFHKGLNPGIGTGKTLNFLKQHIHLDASDRPLQKELELLAGLVLDGSVLNAINRTVKLK